MTGLHRAQRNAYLLSRLLGDVNAARNGRLPQRLVRRAWHRQAYRAMGSAWRWPR